MYSIALEAGRVLFWTKVCYGGAALCVYSSYRFFEVLTGKRSRWQHTVSIIISGILIIAVLVPGELFFIRELNPEKLHSSVLKGPLFPVFVAVILLSTARSLGKLVLVYFKEREEQKELFPIVAGLFLWFISVAFDGIFAAVLSITQPNLWFGPTVLTFCMGIYAGKVLHMKDLELHQVKTEKEEIYSNFIKDNLTGLYTREFFIENLKQRVSLTERKTHDDVVVFIDLDNFKKVNDQLGHQSGDRVLIGTGELLTGVIRRSDITARFGGDEFLMLLIDCGIDAAVNIVEKIMAAYTELVNELFKDKAFNDKLHMSIGLIPQPLWPDEPEAIINGADSAMYSAKKNGKNRYCIYSPDLKGE